MLIEPIIDTAFSPLDIFLSEKISHILVKEESPNCNLEMPFAI